MLQLAPALAVEMSEKTAAAVIPSLLAAGKRSEESLLRRCESKQPHHPFSVFTNAPTPFRKICTPIQAGNNEDNRKITFIPLGPTAAANRAEYR